MRVGYGTAKRPPGRGRTHPLAVTPDARRELAVGTASMIQLQSTAGNQAVLSLLAGQSRPSVQRTLSREVGGILKQWKEKVLAFLGDPLGATLGLELAKHEAVDMSPAIADPAAKKLIGELKDDVLKGALKGDDVGKVMAAHSSIAKQLAKATADYSEEIKKEGEDVVLKAGTTTYRVTDGIT